MRALEAHGARVVTINDASDFAGIRDNIRRVSSQLGQQLRGESLVAEMNARLARAAGAWPGTRVLYVAPGGVTAGPGTLVDAIFRAAGLENAITRPGYQTLSLEAVALHPPSAVVRGFSEGFMLAQNRWGPGRHDVVARASRARVVAALPRAMLACPGWQAAEAAERLARAARR